MSGRCRERDAAQVEALGKLEVMAREQRLVGEDLGAAPVGDDAAAGEDRRVNRPGSSVIFPIAAN